MVDYILGRIDDYLVSAHGKVIYYVGTIFRNCENVRFFQIIQHKINHFTINVVPGDDFNYDLDSKLMVDDLKLLLDNAENDIINIKLMNYDQLIKSKSGKIKVLISELKPRDICI